MSMTEMLLNWVADTFARSDVIDLYFILSDLVDIPQSEAELCETAYHDALCTYQCTHYDNGEDKPLGKQVW